MSKLRILCFGDSNTYGYKPDGSGRFNDEIRWTGLLQKRLGENYQIIEEGLCGRTTVFQDVLREGRRGIDIIGTLIESHNPIDLLVVMLGTNDCKTRYNASAAVIAAGLEKVLEKAVKAAKNELKILVVSPIELGKGVGEEGYDIEFDKNSEETSKELAKEYKKVAEKYNYAFLSAAQYARPSTIDREHLDEEGHAQLATVIEKKIVSILE